MTLILGMASHENNETIVEIVLYDKLEAISYTELEWPQQKINRFLEVQTVIQIVPGIFLFVFVPIVIIIAWKIRSNKRKRVGKKINSS